MIVVRLPFDVPEIGGRKGDALSFSRETGRLCLVRPLEDNPSAWEAFRRLQPYALGDRLPGLGAAPIGPQ